LGFQYVQQLEQQEQSWKVTADRVRLPDGRHVAYEIVGNSRSKNPIFWFHGLASSRCALPWCQVLFNMHSYPTIYLVLSLQALVHHAWDTGPICLAPVGVLMQTRYFRNRGSGGTQNSFSIPSSCHASLWESDEFKCMPFRYEANAPRVDVLREVDAYTIGIDRPA
jgi:hypothetical protein